ncbi:Phosphoserine phosphatase [Penicillium hetheringtonii]|uniref:Phosphoserine phosphatase n=1 Tax=Penicillium hetheringtonii TaxID=911720 RepID=A0AAD6GM41_9EURO|nr:Phosphoserine phosphatase [Penicillium hetheringtonii]
MSALVTTPRFIFFTDFDGTITTDDCNDYLVDNLGFGSERRRQLQKEVLCDRMSFRDSFLEMFNSITAPYNECLDILRQNIKFDSDFREFYDWTQQNNIPIVILSSGTQHMIRTLLDAHLGPDWDIQIVSNEAVPRDGKNINEQGGWKIEFHDDSHHGHDKSLEIRKYSSLPSRPVLLYAGDGISDLSAAKETDLLFAKANRDKLCPHLIRAKALSSCTDLSSWCGKEKLPFVAFDNWNHILQTCKDIVAGVTTVHEVTKNHS